MALTRDFKTTILERAQADPAFRMGLLTEVAECLLNNEPEVAKILLRDHVTATLGSRRSPASRESDGNESKSG